MFGTIGRYKAQLVAKGHTQLPGQDFHQTSSPIVKASNVRIILSLAIAHSWPLQQLIVKNAFLHGSLSEEVYMEQLLVNPKPFSHVCHLNKAPFGLKEATRAWFHKFSSFLLQFGFSYSKANSSLFIYHKLEGIIYLLLYVDDIVVTSNNTKLLTSLVNEISHAFSMKDFGPLCYILGIEVQ